MFNKLKQEEVRKSYLAFGRKLPEFGETYDCVVLYPGVCGVEKIKVITPVVEDYDLVADNIIIVKTAISNYITRLTKLEDSNSDYFAIISSLPQINDVVQAYGVSVNTKTQETKVWKWNINPITQIEDLNGVYKLHTNRYRYYCILTNGFD